MNVKSKFIIITPKKNLLPVNKKSIRIDDSVLHTELQVHFNKVDKKVLVMIGGIYVKNRRNIFKFYQK